MALKIYLDTQDYRYLYTNRNPEREKIYQYLCNQVDQGKIEIFYSYIIVGEFLTNYDKKYKNDREERVQFMKRLCKSNTFVHLNRLVKVNDPFSPDGDWTPLTLHLENAKTTAKQLTDYLSKVNKQLKKTLKGNVSVADLIRQQPNIYNLKLEQKDFPFPLPEQFIKTNIFMRYICGEVSEKSLLNILKEVYIDLDKFLLLWFEHSKQKDFLYDNIQEQGLKLTGIVQMFKEELEKITKIKSLIKTHESDLKIPESRARFKADMQSIKADLISLESLDTQFLKKHIPESALALYPDSFLELLISYARYCIKTNRPVSQSDGADIMNAAYLPYCDFWRGDLSFCDILIRQKVKGYENVVNRLVNLPDAIESKLNSKGLET